MLISLLNASMHVTNFISMSPIHLKVVAHRHKGRFTVSRSYVR
jgi:hypothetical protein